MIGVPVVIRGLRNGGEGGLIARLAAYLFASLMQQQDLYALYFVGECHPLKKVASISRRACLPG